ncbi:MAG: hypothetical protein RMM31_11160 [Anaerolineae bacterium]|nr:hypothetical protein [Anaerolineae bacterium]
MKPLADSKCTTIATRNKDGSVWRYFVFVEINRNGQKERVAVLDREIPEKVRELLEECSQAEPVYVTDRELSFAPRIAKHK